MEKRCRLGLLLGPASPVKVGCCPGLMGAETQGFGSPSPGCLGPWHQGGPKRAAGPPTEASLPLPRLALGVSHSHVMFVLSTGKCRGTPGCLTSSLQPNNPRTQAEGRVAKGHGCPCPPPA